MIKMIIDHWNFLKALIASIKTLERWQALPADAVLGVDTFLIASPEQFSLREIVYA